MMPSTSPSSDTLKTRPGKANSPTNITWFGPGVMQIEFGAPVTAASAAPVGVLPLTGIVRGWRRHVDGELPQEPALGVEHLDAPVGAIADVDAIVAVDRNRVRRVELPRAACPARPTT